MLIFKCPECEDSLMGFNEADETWVCSEKDCQHEISEEEANSLFESGDLVGYVETEDEDLFEEEEEDDDEEDDDMEDGDDDEEEDDEEDDSKDESFNGFENRDTWAVNLVIQNEYKINKSALATISEENAEEALKKFVEEKVAGDKAFEGVFESVDLESVNWEELVGSLKESKEEFDTIRADLEDALGVNEDVSEDDRKAITTVFESALMVRYNELKSSLEEKFSVELDEAKEAIHSELVSQMSGYLEEAVDEWLEENKLAVQHGIQIEMNQKFMDGMRDLFENFYIDVPEERYDVLEDLSDKIEQIEEELSTAKASEAAIQEKLNEANAKLIVNKLSEDLTDTQAEKLEELAGSLDYESEEQFESALGTLKESFLKTPKNRKDGDTIVIEEDLNEDDDSEKKVVRNDPIALAARGLRRKNNN